MDFRRLQDTAGHHREEHRKFLRLPLLLSAACYYNAGISGVICRIVDISSQGLGLEIEAPVRIVNGRLVLLSIDIDSGLRPVSAIARLVWVQHQENAFLIQRAGSRLLFMDPEGKKRLLDQAHSVILSAVSQGGPGVPA